ncbi:MULTISPECIES: flagellar hook-associated protein FlgK [unclassified Sphingomonas]|uniref:flagellar hook-associated protein FlgK n=1 Tax=unclassified Sphingomonas TaxID=196159 RepID=UPI002269A185|nr:MULTISPECIES: flagellar hook-associated protein FlgK [unclassified Sphingomonas]
MSDLLSIGASGVRAYQTALSTIGENIANVGTTGYTRRTVSLSEVPGTGSISQFGAGNGVLLSAVNRSSDTYASTALRATTADLSRTTSGATWLDKIQSALTGNELTTRVTSFFASAQSLAAEPDSSALRTGVVSAAQSAAVAFTATGQAFDQINADMDTAGTQAATDLNSLGASLAQINDGLGRSLPGSTAAAQLMDQRDVILGQMSQLVDVNVQTDTFGRVTVGIGGAAGDAFVKGNQAGTVSYQRNNDGTVGFNVAVNGVVNVLSPNGGSTAGMIDGAQRVATIRQNLNDVATDFVRTVNDNQAAGDDQTGTQGKALFAAGTSPTDMSVLLTNGSDIAAAATGGGTRDASNLAKLQTSRTTKGYEATLTALVTDNATAYKQKNTIADAQSAIRDGAESTLSSKTGVNLDSEAVDLMRFQQAYSASSRIIQVARDTFQSILDIR